MGLQVSCIDYYKVRYLPMMPIVQYYGWPVSVGVAFLCGIDKSLL